MRKRIIVTQVLWKIIPQKLLIFQRIFLLNAGDTLRIPFTYY